MNKSILAVAVTIASLTLAGCGTEANQAAQQPHLQPIDVAKVLVKPVQNWHTYTTRLEAPQEVALMPRVSGVIDKINFKEGDSVKEGDLLFGHRNFRRACIYQAR